MGPTRPVVAHTAEGGELPDVVATRVATGARFVGLFGTATARAPARDGVPGDRISIVLEDGDGWELIDAQVGASYSALTPVVPAAQWYERALHDLLGVRPEGHPRLDPLVLPRPQGAHGTGAGLPRPGAGGRRDRLVPSEDALARHLVGEALFTIPHGPVRGGVTESLEFLVETPGEDIPRLQVRVFGKHRGVEVAFQGRRAEHGVWLAERVEGTASLAHALAYCRALESLAGVEAPPQAQWVRALHAELERITGHLQVAAALCEGAALSVGVARFSHHKETAQRIRHALCGSRFGRSVVVPGGVTAPVVEMAGLAEQVAALWEAVRRDRDALMVTSSFLDRLLTTGLLSQERAAQMGAVGPVGRASGAGKDTRRVAPYGAYRLLEVPPVQTPPRGDCQARLEVRWEEIDCSFGIVISCLDRLKPIRHGNDWAMRLPRLTGRGVGVVEGPQGETGYVVEVTDGRLRRVWPRTASFHNLVLFHDVFNGDVLTDFTFIEASFAVSNAGVVM